MAPTFKTNSLDRQQARQLLWLKRLARLQRNKTPSPPDYSSRVVIPIIRPPAGCERTIPRVLNYQKLPTPTSIRVLKLFPLEQLDNEFDIFKPVQCSIEVKDLNDYPVYDALSYTWGDPSTLFSDLGDVSSAEAWAAPAFDIFCDAKPISVATNLWTALLSLRYALSCSTRKDGVKPNVGEPLIRAHQGHYLWIDALCINQADLEERSKQVLMMSRIYKQAQAVKVWLGGEDHFSRSALPNMEKICRFRVEQADDFQSLQIWDESIYPEIGLPLITPQQWMELYALLNRAWFTRAWIVQEVAMAKNATFICGLLVFPQYLHTTALTFLIRSRWIHQISNLAERRIEPKSPRFRGENTLSLLANDIFVTGDMKLYRPRPGHIFDHNLMWKILSDRAGLLGKLDADTGLKAREGASPEALSVLCNRYRPTDSTDARDKIFAFIGLSSEFVEQEGFVKGSQLVHLIQNPPGTCTSKSQSS